MTFLKQNKIKAIIGGLVVLNVFLFVDNRESGLTATIIETIKTPAPVADHSTSALYMKDNPEDQDFVNRSKTLYWSNVVIDQDKSVYFMRRNMGKSGCEIVEGTKEIPLTCRGSYATDNELSRCASDRTPDDASICELVKWNMDGSQEFISDFNSNQFEIDLIGFYKPRVLLIRYVDPWPHEDTAIAYAYDLNKRTKEALVEWYGGFYNEHSEMTKGNYTLVFQAWNYDDIKYPTNTEPGIWLIDNTSGAKTALSFPGEYPLSEEAPSVELHVKDNWKPSQDITFYLKYDDFMEKWKFNFGTKKFSLIEKIQR